jgi:hypothetical protein
MGVREQSAEENRTKRDDGKGGCIALNDGTLHYL